MKTIGKAKTPTRLLFFVTLAILGLTYSVMLLGVYLSSIHQGLSCLTWPLCPNGFDFPPAKYFYEHFHRTLVFVLLISVVSFTTLSYVRFGNPTLPPKLTLATGLLLVQIFMGWFMIYTKLHPLVVAGHLATGIAFFGILLVTLLSLHHQMKKEK